MTTFSIDTDRVADNLASNTLAQFDPGLPIEHDPYPDYATYVARTHPLGKPHDPRLPGVWYLFGYADCQTLFRLGLGTECPIGGMPAKLGWDFGADVPEGAVDYFEFRKRFLTAQDPPDHTRVRSVIAKFFTPRNIELLRPRIEQMVGSMLDVVEQHAPGPSTSSSSWPRRSPSSWSPRSWACRSTTASTSTRCTSASVAASTWTARSTTSSPPVTRPAGSRTTCACSSRRSAPRRTTT